MTAENDADVPLLMEMRRAYHETFAAVLEEVEGGTFPTGGRTADRMAWEAVLAVIKPAIRADERERWEPALAEQLEALPGRLEAARQEERERCLRIIKAEPPEGDPESVIAAIESGAITLPPREAFQVLIDAGKMAVCPHCSAHVAMVYVHGHLACSRCNRSVADCCEGERGGP